MNASACGPPARSWHVRSPGCGRADCHWGKVAILDGDPGVGKSLVTLDLCARLSIGQPFPDGSLGPGPSNSIVLDGRGDNHLSFGELSDQGLFLRAEFNF